MSLTSKYRIASTVPTPAEGSATLYLDAGVLKVKLPDGSSVEIGGAGGGGGVAGLTPVAWALLCFANGSEAVTRQVGDVITGINVIGTGEYEVQLDPAAGISSAFQLGVQLTCLGTECFATCIASLPSNLITVLIYDAAGSPVSASYVTMTLWYAPDEAP
jgi:hypothetical protein